MLSSSVSLAHFCLALCCPTCRMHSIPVLFSFSFLVPGHNLPGICRVLTYSICFPLKIESHHPAVDRNNINIPCNEFKSHLIPTIISNRQEKSCSTTRGINSKNLVKINCKFFNDGKSLKITYMKARSVNNKTQEIGQHALDFDSDICLITETWLRSGDDITLRQLTPVGYSLLQVPRSNKSGGGVAMLFKSGLNIKEQPAEAHSAFEHMEALLQTVNNTVRLCVPYRPPSSSITAFLQEFAQYMDALSTASGQLIVVGDFNIHCDSADNQHTRKFLDLLNSMNLQQSVEEATHNKGHILDLIITKRTRCGHHPESSCATFISF